jgi:D-alanyl-D-alanine carboxypeptidase/D-alanyl-D-alanine-endopeptidase (penicillin-binding protein 4)
VVRFLLILTPVLLASCASSLQQAFDQKLKATESRFKDHTGFVLYDPVKNEELYSFNGDRYFTPASNTKIFTFYACLKTLGDSIPALRYVQHGDSLIFWGTGDPSFLYKYVHQNGKVLDFLRSGKGKLYFSNANFNTSHFGSGWAWDDYNDYYSAERSPFPIYGNIFSMEITPTGTTLKPSFFKKFQTTGSRQYRPKVERKLESNDFNFLPGRKSDTLDIPFKVEAAFITELLTDTLKRNVTLIAKPIVHGAKTIYSVPTDSVYKVMMQESDNFLAEQLLLICAGVVSDTLQPEIMIRHAKMNYLSDLKDTPVWIDGSGLSRYNLFTPRTIVQLWEKIYDITTKERLFPLLPAGGVSGTLKKWYKGKQRPYVFAKTGTLSNNHCLSGYIVAKSGRTLIFSYMNSNYVAPTSDIRRNMQAILEDVYEKF